jgi:hypothetical protein
LRPAIANRQRYWSSTAWACCAICVMLVLTSCLPDHGSTATLFMAAAMSSPAGLRSPLVPGLGLGRRRVIRYRRNGGERTEAAPGVGWAR